MFLCFSGFWVFRLLGFRVLLGICGFKVSGLRPYRASGFTGSLLATALHFCHNKTLLRIRV